MITKTIIDKIRKHGIVGSAKMAFNPVARKFFGFEIKRISSGGGYISAQKTVKDANIAGLSVGDYVEKMWGIEGGSKYVIEKMNLANIFDKPNVKIVEIGAGTGRYMEKVIDLYAASNIARYESYETAMDWIEYLNRTYPMIISHQADGLSLRQTEDKSIDLVHAHGVFVYTPFITTIRYLFEIFRVIKCGGYAVFDCFVEDCFSEEYLNKWITSGHNFPCIIPEEYLVNLFKVAGLTMILSFHKPYDVAVSKYFIFERI